MKGSLQSWSKRFGFFIKVRIFAGNYAGVSLADPGVGRAPTLVFGAKTYYLKEIGSRRGPRGLSPLGFANGLYELCGLTAITLSDVTDFWLNWDRRKIWEPRCLPILVLRYLNPVLFFLCCIFWKMCFIFVSYLSGWNFYFKFLFITLK